MAFRFSWLNKEVILGISLMLLLVLPVFVMGGNRQVYVDKDANGSQDGSANHPYSSIGKALKNAKGGSEIYISKGTYKENITVPKDVKLFGKKKDVGSVIIKGDSDEPTVTMKDDTELNFLTIEGGRHGIRVMEDAKVKIYKVKVKNSKRDGIHIESAPTNKKHRALLDDVEVRGSERAGIFSEKRDLVIIKSDIHHNGSDGLDLASGMDAWIEGSQFHDNKGSGIKVVLDNASVWTKNNSIRNNTREGVEVNSYGVAGNFGLKKATLVSNNRYGVARIARTSAGTKAFGGIILGTDTNDNRFESNRTGATSPIIRGF